MSLTGLKNYVLAQNLQYDVSYISKWVSGRMLPSEKCADIVLQGISTSLIQAMDDKSRKNLYQMYQVEKDQELQEAIYDNLVTAYSYAKDLEKNKGQNIETKATFYSKLTLQQFSTKMNHPVLRNVNLLNIVTVMDIFAMNHEYRLLITKLESKSLPIRGEYMNVHYSMLLNLEVGHIDYVYDTIFVINMLTNLTHIDFKLYGSSKAYGKIIFVVKDAYIISGMLFGSNHVLAVSTSENEEICGTSYHEIKSMCSRENLLFRKTTMGEMLNKNEYVQLMISRNLRELFGKMTECFLPECLLEEILDDIYDFELWKTDRDSLVRIHNIMLNVLRESAVRIMIYESAFTDFAVTGELDFYNQKVSLTTEQRLKYIDHFLQLLEQNDKIEIKLIHGRFVPDFQYDVVTGLFLSDTLSYVRLNTPKCQNNIQILNQPAIRDVFDHFYEEIWKYPEIIIADPEEVTDAIRHVARSIQILSRLE